MPVMQGLLKQSFTLEQFRAYLKSDVEPRMKAWRPNRIVLHETGPMVWPGFDAKGNKITPAQRIDNISVTWVKAGFQRAPHLLLSYDKVLDVAMVHTMWPLWEYGTHSPSWNQSSWGIEQTGDFTKEPYPDKLRILATGVMKSLYGMVGLHPDANTFSLHKEDPKTTHKLCPGGNCGTKDVWLKRLTESPAAVVTSVATGSGIGGGSGGIAVVKDAHAEFKYFSEPMKTKLKAMEEFRDKPYLLKGIWHIGYGFRDGFKGMKVDAASHMTREEADALFEKSMHEMSDTIQMAVHVPLAQRQLDAIGLFCWNAGTNAFAGSTILKRLNAGDAAGAAAAFDMWNKWREVPTGPLVISPQLTVRRAYERGIFEGKIVFPSEPVSTAAPKPLNLPATAPSSASASQPLPAPKPAAVVVAASPIQVIVPPKPNMPPVAVGPVLLPIQPAVWNWMDRLVYWLICLTAPDKKTS